MASLVRPHCFQTEEELNTVRRLLGWSPQETAWVIRAGLVPLGDLHTGELLSVKTHRRVATGNTKSREVTGALAGTAPSSTARNSVTHPEVLWKTGRAT